MLVIIQTCNLKQKPAVRLIFWKSLSKKNNSICVKMGKYTNIGVVP